MPQKTAKTKLKPVPCPVEHQFQIAVEYQMESPFARARLVEEGFKQCGVCHGHGFTYQMDALNREYMVRCKAFDQYERKVKVYNNARIPNRYHNAMLSEAEKTPENRHIFQLLRALLGNLRDNRATLQPNSQQGSGPTKQKLLKGMVLMGKTGTGKTHLMAGFAYQCILSLGMSCLFQPFDELLNQLRDCYSKGVSGQTVIDPLIRTELLILDDMGKGPDNDWAMGILDQLITSRYNQGSLLLITTNFTEDESTTYQERLRGKDKSDLDLYIADTLKKRVGDRIHSRLKEMCFFESLLGEDLRILNAGS